MESARCKVSVCVCVCVCGELASQEKGRNCVEPSLMGKYKAVDKGVLGGACTPKILKLSTTSVG